MPVIVGMTYPQPQSYPYIGKRFPSRINGAYSMNNLGQLSVKPNWIGIKYRVNQGVTNKLRAIQNI
jgi:hypothetical protein